MDRKTKEQWDWANQYLDKAFAILGINFKHVLDISLATPEDDMKRAIDIDMKLKGGTVGLRIRKTSSCVMKDGTIKRDLTIRSTNRGYKTELQKIQEEKTPRWYVYLWIENDIVTEWMFVDVNIVRKERLWEGKEEIDNYDGTKFIAIPSTELASNSALLDSHITFGRRTNDI